jgi:hypothetical protein
VIILSEETPERYQEIKRIYEGEEMKSVATGQFSQKRFALMFKGGQRHKVDVRLGYYTSLYGLGRHPQDTWIQSVTSTNECRGPTLGSLQNFWRSAENFHTGPHPFYMQKNKESPGKGMLWAVSQAAPLRRAVIDCGLELAYLRLPPKGRKDVDPGSPRCRFQGVIWTYEKFKEEGLVRPDHSVGMDNASGGFMANVTVGGSVELGSQQQFFLRNCTAQEFKGGSWSGVMVDCAGAPESSLHREAPKIVYTVVDTAQKQIHQKVIAEKPFIICETHSEGGDHYSLIVPKAKESQEGTDYSIDPSEVRSFEHVYVATPRDGAEEINRKLALGRDVVFTPGIYNLSEAVNVRKSHQVLLGLGFATLVSPTNNPSSPCIVVDGNAVGVRISGFMLEAGYQHLNGRVPQAIQGPPALLQWGQEPVTRDPTDVNQYCFIHDCFGRVGGQEEPYTISHAKEHSTAGFEACCENMIQINAPCVVGDHLWLWRADHCAKGLVYNHENFCKVGLHVSAKASHVTMMGLFVEHTMGDQTFWEGDYGTTYFYQCELPYDALTPDEAKAEEKNRGTTGMMPYAGSGYHVGPQVNFHEACGVGVYCFFRDHDISVPAAVIVPSRPGITITNAFTVYLNGGPMLHGKGSAQKQYGKIECVVKRGEEAQGPPSFPGTGGKAVFVTSAFQRVL